jgi:hypothetical protein
VLAPPVAFGMPVVPLGVLAPPAPMLLPAPGLDVDGVIEAGGVLEP